jgi:hypothetical protein
MKNVETIPGIEEEWIQDNYERGKLNCDLLQELL